MLQLIFLSLFCTGALGQISGLGKCPYVEAVQNFALPQFVGLWYEIEKYSTIFQLGTKCTTVNFTSNANQSEEVIRQLGILTGNPKTIEGTFELADSSKNEGNLTVTFSGKSFQKLILDTDYTAYAVIYVCIESPLFHEQLLWIMSRQRNPPTSVLEKAYVVLDKFRINKKPLNKTDQKNC